MLCHLNETVQPIHLKYYSFMVQNHPLLQPCRSRPTSVLVQGARLLAGLHKRYPTVRTAHQCSCLWCTFFAVTNPILPFSYAPYLGDGAWKRLFVSELASGLAHDTRSKVPLHRWLLERNWARFPSLGRNGFSTISCSDIPSHWCQWAEDSCLLAKPHDSQPFLFLSLPLPAISVRSRRVTIFCFTKFSPLLVGKVCFSAFPWHPNECSAILWNCLSPPNCTDFERIVMLSWWDLLSRVSYHFTEKLNRPLRHWDEGCLGWGGWKFCHSPGCP